MCSCGRGPADCRARRKAGDRFGHAVEFVLAQIGTHPTDDEGLPLMISAPGDRVSGHSGAGSVLATWVSSNTAVLGPARLITQDTAGIPGKAEAGDAFGVQPGPQHPECPAAGGSASDRHRRAR